MLHGHSSIILNKRMDSPGGYIVLKRIFIVCSVAVALSSCAAISKKSDDTSVVEAAPNVERELAAVKNPNSSDPFESPNEIDKILEETNPVLAEMSADGDKVPLHIPVEINRKVAQWIKYFTVRERERTQRYFERGEALRPHVQHILKENDVPQELYYLAMIESGFVTHAKSHAKAVGVWQFMKGTGKNYGLTVNNQLDERRNWIKATEAAASYLKDLNNVFGSWYLALASYNAGEYRIVRSIMKGKTRDFWALAEAGLLPKETLDYVPKFLAAHIVGRNLKKFGFEIKVAPEDRWEDYETFNVPSGVKLADIAKTSNVPLDTLKKWNMDLLNNTTPYSKTGSVDIYIPKTVSAQMEQAKEKIASLRRYKTGHEDQRAFASKATGGKDEIYVVRRGENLSMISKRLGISVRTIMKVNGLRRGRIHPGQRLKYYSANSANVQSKTSRAIASDKKSGKKKQSRKTAKR